MSNWIPTSGPGSRLPTQEDANETGCILVRDAKSSLWFTSIQGLQPHAVAWLPLPHYTPPEPGPTDEEIRLLFIGARGNSWVAQDIRRWFADVTARIEREKQT